MLPGIFSVENVKLFARSGLDNPALDFYGSAYQNNLVLTPANVFTDLAVDISIEVPNCHNAWEYSLVGDLCRATQDLILAFPGGLAGEVYYGIAFYSQTGSKLFYANAFPVPFTVPVGGLTFGVRVTLPIGDKTLICS